MRTRNPSPPAAGASVHRPGAAAAARATAFATILLAVAAWPVGAAAAPPSELVDIGGGRVLRIPVGVIADLAPAPPGPGVPGGEGAVVFRYADGRLAYLVTGRSDAASELPQPGEAPDYDGRGIAPLKARADNGLRSYLVRTGNPDYPAARVLCGGEGGSASCRLYTRVGADSVLDAPLTTNDPALVAESAAAYAALIAK